MSEPIAAVGAVAAQAASRSAAIELPQQAQLQTPTLRAPAAGGAMREATTTLGDFSARVFGREAGGPAEMLAGVERAALSSISPQDYLRASLVATDLSMHVSMSMMKFHLSSSLGSAATGLFNTLLKNRE